MGEVIMKQPDGKYSTTDGSNMLGGDYHRTINASDGTIPEEDIKRYYDIAMKLDWQDGWYSSEEMKAEAKTSVINIFILVEMIPREKNTR